jgi:hypothetical protein
VPAGCHGPNYPDPALEGLELMSVNPGTLVPGSVLVLEGRSFVGEPWGTPRLLLRGSFAGKSLQASVPARFIDYEHLEVDCDDAMLAALGAAEGTFSGSARVEVESAIDFRRHVSPPRPLELEILVGLSPQLTSAGGDDLVFVNDPIKLAAAGLLLSSGEGTTQARVSGCFRRSGQPRCNPSAPVDVPVAPASRFDRASGTFPFSPSIAGIREGSFLGEVRLRNTHRSGEVRESSSVPLHFELTEAAVLDALPRKVSLGNTSTFAAGALSAHKTAASRCSTSAVHFRRSAAARCCR